MGGREVERDEEEDEHEEDGEGPDPDDVLSEGWKVGLYAAALVPCGSWFVVLGSSILYYSWRKEFPNKAKAINRHGWIAWLLGLLIWGGIWFLLREGATATQAVPELRPAIAALNVATQPSLRQRRAEVMGGIYQKVVDDSIAQYEIVKRHGTTIELCVHAGMVSAAQLQAKDEAAYAKWKEIEKADCIKAGIARP
jgi:hypothetical protein